VRAYDIDMLTRPADRALPEHKGWCFGLPPGISQQQWPLDPNSGYPLMHGFTLLLPEDYRVHGPDLVALSFFAVSCRQPGCGTTIAPWGFASLRPAHRSRAPRPALCV
jgi:hypothetical protein